MEHIVKANNQLLSSSTEVFLDLCRADIQIYHVAHSMFIPKSQGLKPEIFNIVHSRASKLGLPALFINDIRDALQSSLTC